MSPATAIPHHADVRLDVDGKLDEPEWATAAQASSFVTSSPAPGSAPTGDTELRLMTDEHGLYAAFVARDPEPERLRSGFGRRDTRWGDDGVALYVDPTGLAQRAYVFGCNASGSPFEGIRAAGADSDDLSWDARWFCATRHTSDGYVVEMSIPWSAMRHPVDMAHIGILATRLVSRVNEQSTWPELDPNRPSLLAQQRSLGGPGRLASRGRSGRLALTPELTFGWDQEGLSDDRLSLYGLGPGLTVRVAPSPVTTLLATFNPDFSQVESDSAQVTINRRYAIDLEEKRSFFLEGQEWFDHVAGPLVYTRSMTAPIEGARATVEAAGWTVAALQVLDAHPAPTVSEGGGFLPPEDAAALESVGRIRYGFGQGSWVGALGSDRTVPEAGLGSRMGGVDAGLRLSERWSWTGAVLGSSTSGLGDGLAAETSLSYGADRLRTAAELTWISPDFRAENGFLVYADRLGADGELDLLGYPSGAVRQWMLIPLRGEVAATGAGAPRSAAYGPELWLRFANGWRAMVGAEASGEAFSGAWLDSLLPTTTAGGPVGRALHLWARAHSGTSPFYDPSDPRVGHLDRLELEVDVQAGRRLAILVSGEADRMTDGPALAPTDDPVLYAGFVGRVQGTAFATPSLWARATLDRSTFDARTAGGLLVAWERSPGTALYVGGSVATTDARPDASEWAALVKASWRTGS